MMPKYTKLGKLHSKDASLIYLVGLYLLWRLYLEVNEPEKKCELIIYAKLSPEEDDIWAIN